MGFKTMTNVNYKIPLTLVTHDSSSRFFTAMHIDIIVEKPFSGI